MKLTNLLLFAAVLVTWATVNAQEDEERIVEVWTCTLNEGQTQEDVQTSNSRWVAFMNAQVEGGDIRSYVLTSIVGNTGEFLYVDSFPNMPAWSAAKAATETDEGQAIEAELNEDATCSSNTLHQSTQS
jgi:hypothetical protein